MYICSIYICLLVSARLISYHIVFQIFHSFGDDPAPTEFVFNEVVYGFEFELQPIDHNERIHFRWSLFGCPQGNSAPSAVPWYQSAAYVACLTNFCVMNQLLS